MLPDTCYVCTHRGSVVTRPDGDRHLSLLLAFALYFGVVGMAYVLLLIRGRKQSGVRVLGWRVQRGRHLLRRFSGMNGTS